MSRSDDVWQPAFIGIGSNLGGPEAQVLAAFDRLAELPRTRLTLRSSLYRSAPLGPRDQPDFVNAVAGLLTRLPPVDLLEALLGIEVAAGRIRDEDRWGPRSLDLDLLVVADHVIDSESLTLPHPRIAERNFVLLPFAEIAADFHIPGVGRVADIACNAFEPHIERIG